MTSPQLAALAALILELRPDLGPVLAASFVVEALDHADAPSIAELHPQARWAAMREEMPAPKARSGGPDYGDPLNQLERRREREAANYARLHGQEVA